MPVSAGVVTISTSRGKPHHHTTLTRLNSSITSIASAWRCFLILLYDSRASRKQTTLSDICVFSMSEDFQHDWLTRIWPLDECMNEWMNERMNGWTDEWMNEWIDGWMNGWMNERMNRWKNEWMNERTHGWMNERTNERMNERTNRMHGWIN